MVFAATALLVPLYRVVVPHWPEGVTEWIDDDGRLRLLPAGARVHADSVVRSQPLNAARVILDDASALLGYTGVIRCSGQPAAVLPQARYWTPPIGRQCELVLVGAEPASEVRWLPCDRIRRVVWPNRMDGWARLRLALLRTREHLQRNGNGLSSAW